MKDGNFGKEIFKGTVWSFIDNFSRQGITFGVFIVLARLLDPQVFGLLSVATLIVQVFKSITYDSIGTAIIRKAKPTDLEYNTGFWTCIGLSIPAFLALFIMADLLEKWIGSKGLAEVIRSTSFIILISGLTRMHEARLTHNLNFKSLTIRSTISVILGGAAGIVLALRGYGVYSLVGQQLVTSFTELLLLWFITPWRPRFEFSKESFVEIVSYSKHLAVTGLTNFANQNSDVFFITYYLGSRATGIYTMGKRIVNTLNTVISTSLLRVSLPAFARIQDDDAELKRTYLNSVTLTAAVTAPLFTGLSVLSKDITLFMLGDKWLEAVPVMQIVTVIGFLTSIGYYNQSIMLAKNKPQWQTRLTFLYAVSNIAAFIAFTRFGVVYTALAYTGRALILYPVSVWCALQLTSINWRSYISALTPSIISSLVMAAILIVFSFILTGVPVAVRLFLQILTGIVSYVACIYITVPLSHREKALQTLKKIVK